MEKTFIEVNSKIRDADNCAQQGNFALAASIYQGLIEHQPNNAFLYNKLGQVKAQAQKWEQAINNYQQALKLGIKPAFWTYKNLGDVLRELKRYDEAISNYQRAINLDPKQPDVYDSLGQVQSLQGDYTAAIASYQKAIDLGIANPFWTYQNLGDALNQLGRLDEAQAAYQQGPKVKAEVNENIEVPSPPKLLDKTEDNSWLEVHNQGDKYFIEKDWSQAIAFYQQAIELNPNYFWSHYNLGRALSQLQRWSEALVHYQKALELQPSNELLIVLLQELGHIFEQLGDYEQAISAYRNLGDALIQENRVDEAQQAYRQKQKLEENNFPLQNIPDKSLELRHLEDADTAHEERSPIEIQSAQTEADLPPSPANSLPQKNVADYFELGKQYAEVGKLAQAIDCFRKAAVLNPDQAHYHQRLADTLMQNGQFDEAIIHYSDSLELNPDNPWTCRGLANALQSQKQFEKATVLYYRSIELFPDDYHTYESLGEALSKWGKFAEAIEAYREAMKRKPQESQFQQRIEALKRQAGPDYFRLGEEKAAAQKWQEASVYYREAIALNFETEHVYHRLGYALFQQDQLQEALSLYKTALKLNPNCWHSNKGLGSVLERLGNHQEALIAYRHALEVQPAQEKVGQKLNSDLVPMDVVVTYNEVNNKHGTGILVLRLFQNSPDIFSIRSRSDYAGEQDFGKVAVHCECSGLTRSQVYQKVAEEMVGIKPQRILCVPYSPYDLLIAIAIADLFGIKLCIYIMDDQNVREHNISDELMAEALKKSSLRLAISPEIRDAYEQKYKLDFWLLPGLVPDKFVQHQVTESNLYQPYARKKKGILVGNIWAQRWLDSLRNTIRELDLTIDWYANPNPGGLRFNKSELREDGLIQKGLVPEFKLVQILRQYPYAILPTGSTDESDDRPEISKLSLPSRIPFIWATSNTPIVVLGSRETAAGRFVQKFEAGLVCDYHPQKFEEAVEYICAPENQAALRQNAVNVGQALSVQGIDRWLWNSLEQGEPHDLRFERLLPRISGKNNFITGKTSAMDVIVNHNEINNQHGTGILLLRLFQDSTNIFSIRTNNHYEGEQDFGNIAIYCDCVGLSRAEIFLKIAQQTKDIDAQKILCVPYYTEDILVSLAIKEIFGIPLCTYIMDDQNIYEQGIPDELLKEVLEKSDLRLAISPELGQAYEDKYQLKFWVLPAVAPKEYLQTTVQVPETSNPFYAAKTGVLIGNIWAQRWLDSLRQILKTTKIKIDWYGAPNPTDILFHPEELEQDGLIKRGFVPEKELVDLLRQYPYAVLTTGSTEELDDRPEMAKLSLPSRLTYITAISNTPLIILGSNATAAARFVERFKIGVVCDYTADSFRQAVEYISRPEVQQTLRHNATKVALNLSSEGVERWIWESLKQKHPQDLRFENFNA